MNARDSAIIGDEPQGRPEDPVFPESVGPGHPEPAAPMRPPFPRPILLVALAYIAGLTLGRMLMLPPLLPALLAAGLAILAAGVLFLRRDSTFRAPSSGMTLLVALALLGWAASNAALREESLAAETAKSFENAAFCRIQGKVSQVDRLADEGIRIRVEKPSVQPVGTAAPLVPFPMAVELVFFGPGAETNSQEGREKIVHALHSLPGSRIVTWARPSISESASHPWDFDRSEYNRHRGIGARLYLPSLALVEIAEPPGAPWRFINRALTMSRESVRRALGHHASPEAASIARAMVLGERGAISGEVRTSFRNSGLAHILVVSGLHTAFILALALFLSRLAGLPPWAWAIMGLLALAVFTGWVGFRPPVVRASIMGAFLVGAWWLGRPASTLAGLAAASFLTLLIDPRNLLRPDWQLSYACVLSLTLLMPPLVELVKTVTGDRPDAGEPHFPLQPLKRFVQTWVLFPAAAVLAILMGLLPFQIHYFGQVNLSTIASNLAAIPLAYATLFSTLVFAMFHELPGLGAALGSVIDASAHGLLVCARRFEDPRIVRVQLSSLHPVLVAAYALFLLAGPHLVRNERGAEPLNASQRRHVILRILGFLAILAWAPVAARAAGPDHLEVYLLDVGQGDAIVLRAPGGTVGVIDGGGGLEGGEGEKTLVPFLRGLGVSKLAFVAATHADTDHVGGLDAVIEAFDVPLLLAGSHETDTVAWREVIDAAAAHHVRIRRVRAGDRLGGFGAAEIRFLGPSPGQSGNDASLVMLLDYEEVEILLTGDVERAAEFTLLEENERLDIDVLKVAHHGSATSTTEAFLRGFSPELALISAGRNNRFGHPSPEVLQRLESHGIAVARTDFHGSLRLTTDGSRMRLEHFGRRPGP